LGLQKFGQVKEVNSAMARKVASTLALGDWAPLCPVAGLFRPKSGGKPLVVSPGHLDSEGLCLMFDVTKKNWGVLITCEFGKYSKSHISKTQS